MRLPPHASQPEPPTYAELALGAGVRREAVSRQLGHSSISTTANVYTHDTDEAAAEATRIVGRTIEGEAR